MKKKTADWVFQKGRRLWEKNFNIFMRSKTALMW
jgi:hypothetical protein